MEADADGRDLGFREEERCLEMEGIWGNLTGIEARREGVEREREMEREAAMTSLATNVEVFWTLNAFIYWAASEIPCLVVRFLGVF